MNEPAAGFRPSATPLPTMSPPVCPLTDLRLSLLQQQTGASRREILLFFRQYDSVTPTIPMVVTSSG